MRRLVLLTALLSGGLVPVLGAQANEHVDARALAPGVTYRKITDAHGPWVMHLLRVDLRRADLAIRPARAHDSLRSRERTSAMVRRATDAGAHVLAAVNADFFDLESGENENNQVIAGEWWKGVKVADSPYDTYDNAHSQLALDSLRRPSMDRFMFVGRALARGHELPILTLNAWSAGTYEGTALFTPRYGATTPPRLGATTPTRSDAATPHSGATTPRSGAGTPRDTVPPIAEAAMAAVGHRGDTALYVRRGRIASTSGTTIPRDGAVLSGFGPRAAEIAALADGDTVRVVLGTMPALTRRRQPALVVGGWPRILRAGRNVAAEAATVEGTISRNAEARHPRTVVGFSRDSSTLLLLVVDGRSSTSVGMTLVEVADRMRQLGAWDALNFDGGGSTTMVIGGAVVNAPSDATGEREVGNALLVVRTP